MIAPVKKILFGTTALVEIHEPSPVAWNHSDLPREGEMMLRSGGSRSILEGVRILLVQPLSMDQDGAGVAERKLQHRRKE